MTDDLTWDKRRGRALYHRRHSNLPMYIQHHHYKSIIIIIPGSNFGQKSSSGAKNWKPYTGLCNYRVLYICGRSCDVLESYHTVLRHQSTIIIIIIIIIIASASSSCIPFSCYTHNSRSSLFLRMYRSRRNQKMK